MYTSPYNQWSKHVGIWDKSFISYINNPMLQSYILEVMKNHVEWKNYVLEMISKYKLLCTYYNFPFAIIFIHLLMFALFISVYADAAFLSLSDHEFQLMVKFVFMRWVCSFKNLFNKEKEWEMESMEMMSLMLGERMQSRLRKNKSSSDTKSI